MRYGLVKWWILLFNQYNFKSIDFLTKLCCFGIRIKMWLDAFWFLWKSRLSPPQVNNENVWSIYLIKVIEFFVCRKWKKKKKQFDSWTNLKLAHYGEFWMSALRHINRKIDENVSYYQIQSKHIAFQSILPK